MAVSRVACRAQLGLQAPLVQVEVSLASGLPAFSIVGLPATVVKESKERVRAALTHSRFEFPAGRITVSLSPAELPKEGGRFDLPIALGILLASGQLRCAGGGGEPAGEFYGELGLAGELKPVRGLLLAAAHARSEQREIVVPHGNAAEACAAAPQQARAAGHLLEVCAHLTGAAVLPRCTALPAAAQPAAPDLAEVRGQVQAKRALVTAAAGGHSLLLVGPPGCGKSMLARRLPGLLPPLTEGEALEVAAVAAASAAGFDPARFGERPFRAPHHCASVVALVGGGARARPGELSLAHHGVLFLDELAEFARPVLEALREPLEMRTVAVARAALQTQYPAACLLVAAMNPCPCGNAGDPARACRCTATAVRRYRARLSGPLLDRFDMEVGMSPLAAGDFAAPALPVETSAAAAERVARARTLQLRRQGMLNGHLPDALIERWCLPDAAGQRLLDRAMTRWGLTGRARQRTLRVARTIADLAAGTAATAGAVTAEHVGEALLLRAPDGDATAPSSPCSPPPP